MRIKTTVRHSYTPILIERPKSKPLAAPDADEFVEQQELSSPVGLENDPATLEDGLAASLGRKQALTVLSTSHTIGYLPREVENLCPHKSLHRIFHNLFIMVKVWKQLYCPAVGEWINCGMFR